MPRRCSLAHQAQTRAMHAATLAGYRLAVDLGAVTIHAPVAPPTVAPLVKSLIDGVVCALQAHTDTTTLVDVADRLASWLPPQPTRSPTS